MSYCLCIMADLSSWLTEKSGGIKTFKQKIVLRTKETTKGLRGLKDHRNTSCFALLVFMRLVSIPEKNSVTDKPIFSL